MENLDEDLFKLFKAYSSSSENDNSSIGEEKDEEEEKEAEAETAARPGVGVAVSDNLENFLEEILCEIESCVGGAQEENRCGESINLSL